MDIDLGLILTGAAVVIGTPLALSTIVITRQKTVKIVETLGRFSGTRNPGLSFKLPAPFSVVAETVNMQIMELSDDVGVKSVDNAFLTIPISVQYQVMDAKTATYELDDAEEQLKRFINNKILGIASDMDMDDLFKARKTFEEEIISDLEGKFETFGFKIKAVLIGDPQPSEALKASFDQKLVAEREKDAAGAKAEALKIKMVGEAQAEKASLELKGKALAHLRDTIAEGNAEAMQKMLKDVPGLTPQMVLRFFETIDTNEAYRDMASRGNAVIIAGGQSESPTDLAMIQGLIDAANNKYPSTKKPTAKKSAVEKSTADT